jgi:hypothetical protein
MELSIAIKEREKEREIPIHYKRVTPRGRRGKDQLQKMDRTKGKYQAKERERQGTSCFSSSKKEPISAHFREVFITVGAVKRCPLKEVLLYICVLLNAEKHFKWIKKS